MSETYSVRDFSDIKYKNPIYLSEEEMNKIKEIADSLNIYINPPSMDKEIDNFRPTPIKEKKENPDNIRKFLNKITEKNYSKYKDMIITNIKNIEDKTELENIGKLIFTIASSNIFNSFVYAKLCKEIIKNCNFMDEIIQNNFKQFIELFDDIQYCDPNKDYEKFCEYNKENTKRKSFSTFYINLLKEEILDKNKIIELIFKLIGKFNIIINDDNTHFICEEIVDNLFILIIDGKDYLKECKEEWENICFFLENAKQLNISTNSGFTNKIKFKLMDICDNII